MNINNIVVVRFSLIMVEEWLVTAYGGKLEDRDSWFEMRSKLFIKTLYAAIEKQTTPPAKVFLLMDKIDVDSYKKYLNLDSKIFIPIFSENWNHYDQVANTIQELGLTNLAVSRIDSDDLISKIYFEQINTLISSEISKGGTFEYIVATCGYRSDFHSIQEIFYNCSPFITFFEEKFSGKNIYDLSHEDVINKAHLAIQSAKWMQIIHQKNIGNSFMDSKMTIHEFEEIKKSNPKLIASAPHVVSPGFFEDF